MGGGGYLLLLVNPPWSPEHKEAILQRVAKGLLSWDVKATGTDLSSAEKACLSVKVSAGPHNELLIQHSTETLALEVLLNPEVSTFKQCFKNMMVSGTTHKHVIHAGYAFAGSGDWILQDGIFGCKELEAAITHPEVTEVLEKQRFYTLHVHCSPEGSWSQPPVGVSLNPPDIVDHLAGSNHLLSCLETVLTSPPLTSLLPSSSVVGNIRFRKPTMYVFPGGQGDCALFGVTGFTLLVDGGFSRKPCFWEFVRHLDRLDSLLVTRFNQFNSCGLTALAQRKALERVYPQVGHVFYNAVKSPSDEELQKDRDQLIVSVIAQGLEFLQGVRGMGIAPQACQQDPYPLTLYHKVGQGTLEMYVLSPAQVNDEDSSVCVLLVWRPAKVSEPVTRILLPGSAPQSVIFEGLRKLSHISVLKSRVVTPEERIGFKRQKVQEKPARATSVPPRSSVARRLTAKSESPSPTPTPPEKAKAATGVPTNKVPGKLTKRESMDSKKPTRKSTKKEPQKTILDQFPEKLGEKLEDKLSAKVAAKVVENLPDKEKILGIIGDKDAERSAEKELLNLISEVPSQKQATKKEKALKQPDATHKKVEKVDAKREPKTAKLSKAPEKTKGAKDVSNKKTVEAKAVSRKAADPIVPKSRAAVTAATKPLVRDSRSKSPASSTSSSPKHAPPKASERPIRPVRGGARSAKPTATDVEGVPEATKGLPKSGDKPTAQVKPDKRIELVSQSADESSTSRDIGEEKEATEATKEERPCLEPVSGDEARDGDDRSVKVKDHVDDSLPKSDVHKAGTPAEDVIGACPEQQPDTQKPLDARGKGLPRTPSPDLTFSASSEGVPSLEDEVLEVSLTGDSATPQHVLEPDISRVRALSSGQRTPDSLDTPREVGDGTAPSSQQDILDAMEKHKLLSLEQVAELKRSDSVDSIEREIAIRNQEAMRHPDSSTPSRYVEEQEQPLTPEEDRAMDVETIDPHIRNAEPLRTLGTSPESLLDTTPASMENRIGEVETSAELPKKSEDSRERHTEKDTGKTSVLSPLVVDDRTSDLLPENERDVVETSAPERQEIKGAIDDDEERQETIETKAITTRENTVLSGKYESTSTVKQGEILVEDASEEQKVHEVSPRVSQRDEETKESIIRPDKATTESELKPKADLEVPHAQEVQYEKSDEPAKGKEAEHEPLSVSDVYKVDAKSEPEAQPDAKKKEQEEKDQPALGTDDVSSLSHSETQQDSLELLKAAERETEVTHTVGEGAPQKTDDREDAQPTVQEDELMRENISKLDKTRIDGELETKADFEAPYAQEAPYDKPDEITDVSAKAKDVKQECLSVSEGISAQQEEITSDQEARLVAEEKEQAEQDRPSLYSEDVSSFEPQVQQDTIKPLKAGKDTTQMASAIAEDGSKKKEGREDSPGAAQDEEMTESVLKPDKIIADDTHKNEALLEALSGQEAPCKTSDDILDDSANGKGILQERPTVPDGTSEYKEEITPGPIEPLDAKKDEPKTGHPSLRNDDVSCFEPQVEHDIPEPLETVKDATEDAYTIPEDSSEKKKDREVSPLSAQEEDTRETLPKPDKTVINDVLKEVDMEVSYGQEAPSKKPDKVSDESAKDKEVKHETPSVPNGASEQDEVITSEPEAHLHHKEKEGTEIDRPSLHTDDASFFEPEVQQDNLETLKTVKDATEAACAIVQSGSEEKEGRKESPPSAQEEEAKESVLKPHKMTIDEERQADLEVQYGEEPSKKAGEILDELEKGRDVELKLLDVPDDQSKADAEIASEQETPLDVKTKDKEEKHRPSFHTDDANTIGPQVQQDILKPLKTGKDATDENIAEEDSEKKKEREASQRAVQGEESKESVLKPGEILTDDALKKETGLEVPDEHSMPCTKLDDIPDEPAKDDIEHERLSVPDGTAEHGKVITSEPEAHLDATIKEEAEVQPSLHTDDVGSFEPQVQQDILKPPKTGRDTTEVAHDITEDYSERKKEREESPPGVQEEETKETALKLDKTITDDELHREESLEIPYENEVQWGKRHEIPGETAMGKDVKSESLKVSYDITEREEEIRSEPEPRLDAKEEEQPEIYRPLLHTGDVSSFEPQTQRDIEPVKDATKAAYTITEYGAEKKEEHIDAAQSTEEDQGTKETVVMSDKTTTDDDLETNAGLKVPYGQGVPQDKPDESTIGKDANNERLRIQDGLIEHHELIPEPEAQLGAKKQVQPKEDVPTPRADDVSFPSEPQMLHDISEPLKTDKDTPEIEYAIAEDGSQKSKERTEPPQPAQDEGIREKVLRPDSMVTDEELKIKASMEVAYAQEVPYEKPDEITDTPAKDKDIEPEHRHLPGVVSKHHEGITSEPEKHWDDEKKEQAEKDRPSHHIDDISSSELEIPEDILKSEKDISDIQIVPASDMKISALASKIEDRDEETIKKPALDHVESEKSPKSSLAELQQAELDSVASIEHPEFLGQTTQAPVTTGKTLESPELPVVGVPRGPISTKGENLLNEEPPSETPKDHDVHMQVAEMVLQDDQAEKEVKDLPAKTKSVIPKEGSEKGQSHISKADTADEEERASDTRPANEGPERISDAQTQKRGSETESEQDTSKEAQRMGTTHVAIPEMSEAIGRKHLPEGDLSRPVKISEDEEEQETKPDQKLEPFQEIRSYEDFGKSSAQLESSHEDFTDTGKLGDHQRSFITEPESQDTMEEVNFETSTRFGQEIEEELPTPLTGTDVDIPLDSLKAQELICEDNKQPRISEEISPRGTSFPSEHPQGDLDDHRETGEGQRGDLPGDEEQITLESESPEIETFKADKFTETKVKEEHEPKTEIPESAEETAPLLPPEQSLETASEAELSRKSSTTESLQTAALKRESDVRDLKDVKKPDEQEPVAEPKERTDHERDASTTSEMPGSHITEQGAPADAVPSAPIKKVASDKAPEAVGFHDFAEDTDGYEELKDSGDSKDQHPKESLPPAQEAKPPYLEAEQPGVLRDQRGSAVSQTEPIKADVVGDSNVAQVASRPTDTTVGGKSNDEVSNVPILSDSVLSTGVVFEHADASILPMSVAQGEVPDNVCLTKFTPRDLEIEDVSQRDKVTAFVKEDSVEPQQAAGEFSDILYDAKVGGADIAKSQEHGAYESVEARKSPFEGAVSPVVAVQSALELDLSSATKMEQGASELIDKTGSATGWSAQGTEESATSRVEGTFQERFSQQTPIEVPEAQTKKDLSVTEHDSSGKRKIEQYTTHDEGVGLVEPESPQTLEVHDLPVSDVSTRRSSDLMTPEGQISPIPKGTLDISLDNLSIEKTKGTFSIDEEQRRPPESAAPNKGTPDHDSISPIPGGLTTSEEAITKRDIQETALAKKEAAHITLSARSTDDEMQVQFDTSSDDATSTHEHGAPHSVEETSVTSDGTRNDLGLPLGKHFGGDANGEDAIAFQEGVTTGFDFRSPSEVLKRALPEEQTEAFIVGTMSEPTFQDGDEDDLLETLKQQLVSEELLPVKSTDSIQLPQKKEQDDVPPAEISNNIIKEKEATLEALTELIDSKDSATLSVEGSTAEDVLTDAKIKQAELKEPEIETTATASSVISDSEKSRKTLTQISTTPLDSAERDIVTLEDDIKERLPSGTQDPLSARDLQQAPQESTFPEHAEKEAHHQEDIVRRESQADPQGTLPSAAVSETPDNASTDAPMTEYTEASSIDDSVTDRKSLQIPDESSTDEGAEGTKHEVSEFSETISDVPQAATTGVKEPHFDSTLISGEGDSEKETGSTASFAKSQERALEDNLSEILPDPTSKAEECRADSTLAKEEVLEEVARSTQFSEESQDQPKPESAPFKSIEIVSEVRLTALEDDHKQGETTSDAKTKNDQDKVEEAEKYVESALDQESKDHEETSLLLSDKPSDKCSIKESTDDSQGISSFAEPQKDSFTEHSEISDKITASVTEPTHDILKVSDDLSVGPISESDFQVQKYDAHKDDLTKVAADITSSAEMVTLARDDEKAAPVSEPPKSSTEPVIQRNLSRDESQVVHSQLEDVISPEDAPTVSCEKSMLSTDSHLDSRSEILDEYPTKELSITKSQKIAKDVTDVPLDSAEEVAQHVLNETVGQFLPEQFEKEALNKQDIIVEATAPVLDTLKSHPEAKQKPSIELKQPARSPTTQAPTTAPVPDGAAEQDQKKLVGTYQTDETRALEEEEFSDRTARETLDKHYKDDDSPPPGKIYSEHDIDKDGKSVEKAALGEVLGTDEFLKDLSVKDELSQAKQPVSLSEPPHAPQTATPSSDRKDQAPEESVRTLEHEGATREDDSIDHDSFVEGDQQICHAKPEGQMSASDDGQQERSGHTFEKVESSLKKSHEECSDIVKQKEHLEKSESGFTAKDAYSQKDIDSEGAVYGFEQVVQDSEREKHPSVIHEEITTRVAETSVVRDISLVSHEPEISQSGDQFLLTKLTHEASDPQHLSSETLRQEGDKECYLKQGSGGSQTTETGSELPPFDLSSKKHHGQDEGSVSREPEETVFHESAFGTPHLPDGDVCTMETDHHQMTPWRDSKDTKAALLDEESSLEISDVPVKDPRASLSAAAETPLLARTHKRDSIEHESSITSVSELESAAETPHFKTIHPETYPEISKVSIDDKERTSCPSSPDASLPTPPLKRSVFEHQRPCRKTRISAESKHLIPAQGSSEADVSSDEEESVSKSAKDPEPSHTEEGRWDSDAAPDHHAKSTVPYSLDHPISESRDEGEGRTRVPIAEEVEEGTTRRQSPGSTKGAENGEVEPSRTAVLQEVISDGELSTTKPEPGITEQKTQISSEGREAHESSDVPELTKSTTETPLHDRDISSSLRQLTDKTGSQQIEHDNADRTSEGIAEPTPASTSMSPSTFSLIPQQNLGDDMSDGQLPKSTKSEIETSSVEAAVEPESSQSELAADTALVDAYTKHLEMSRDDRLSEDSSYSMTSEEKSYTELERHHQKLSFTEDDAASATVPGLVKEGSLPLEKKTWVEQPDFKCTQSVTPSTPLKPLLSGETETGLDEIAVVIGLEKEHAVHVAPENSLAAELARTGEKLTRIDADHYMAGDTATTTDQGSCFREDENQQVEGPQFRKTEGIASLDPEPVTEVLEPTEDTEQEQKHGIVSGLLATLRTELCVMDPARLLKGHILENVEKDAQKMPHDASSALDQGAKGEERPESVGSLTEYAKKENVDPSEVKEPELKKGLEFGAMKEETHAVADVDVSFSSYAETEQISSKDEVKGAETQSQRLQKSDISDDTTDRSTTQKVTRFQLDDKREDPLSDQEPVFRQETIEDRFTQPDIVLPSTLTEFSAEESQQTTFKKSVRLEQAHEAAFLEGATSPQDRDSPGQLKMSKVESPEPSTPSDQGSVVVRHDSGELTGEDVTISSALYAGIPTETICVTQIAEDVKRGISESTTQDQPQTALELSDQVPTEDKSEEDAVAVAVGLASGLPVELVCMVESQDIYSEIKRAGEEAAQRASQRKAECVDNNELPLESSDVAELQNGFHDYDAVTSRLRHVSDQDVNGTCFEEAVNHRQSGTSTSSSGETSSVEKCGNLDAQEAKSDPTGEQDPSIFGSRPPASPSVGLVAGLAAGLATELICIPQSVDFCNDSPERSLTSTELPLQDTVCAQETGDDTKHTPSALAGTHDVQRTEEASEGSFSPYPDALLRGDARAATRDQVVHSSAEQQDGGILEESLDEPSGRRASESRSTAVTYVHKTDHDDGGHDTEWEGAQPECSSATSCTEEGFPFRLPRAGVLELLSQDQQVFGDDGQLSRVVVRRYAYDVSTDGDDQGTPILRSDDSGISFPEQTESSIQRVAMEEVARITELAAATASQSSKGGTIVHRASDSSAQRPLELVRPSVLTRREDDQCITHVFEVTQGTGYPAEYHLSVGYPDEETCLPPEGSDPQTILQFMAAQTKQAAKEMLEEQPLYEEDEDVAQEESSASDASPLVEEPVFTRTLQPDCPELVELSGGNTPSEPQSPRSPLDSRTKGNGGSSSSIQRMVVVEEPEPPPSPARTQVHHVIRRIEGPLTEIQQTWTLEGGVAGLQAAPEGYSNIVQGPANLYQTQTTITSTGEFPHSIATGDRQNQDHSEQNVVQQASWKTTVVETRQILEPADGTSQDLQATSVFTETNGERNGHRSDAFNVRDWGKPLGLPVPPDSSRSYDKSSSKTPRAKKAQQGDIVYVDLTYVPHHGDPGYCDVDFFSRVRARYYVLSGTNPSQEVLNALLEAKRSWNDPDAPVTVIPTYETDALCYWIAHNQKSLEEQKIDVAPSASRCTINLQDHESSCAAYRLEF